ncbi:MAG: carbohydrate ABC transporter substrate-binding protein, partial [Actinobacteria bacterium]|nr:carbohydrate ABC transporter substrate-binding protein [Actinomycetota bacterium]
MAACSTTSGSTGGSNGPGPGVALSSTSPAALHATITYWSWDGASYTAAKVAAFNKVYPNIKVDAKSFPSTSAYVAALGPALASGEGPDVYNLEPGEDITQYGSLSSDLTPLVESALGADWRSKLAPGAVQELTLDGKLVAAPNGASGAGTLLVNVGLAQQLGLPLPTASMSLDDLISYCGKVRAAGKTCISMGAKDEWAAQDVFQAIADSVAPGKYAKAVAGTLSWADPDLVKAFGIWQGFFDDGVFQKGALGDAEYPTAANVWLKQNALMTPLGTWEAGEFVAKTNEAAQSAAGVSNPKPMTSVFINFPSVGGHPVSIFASVGSGSAINAASKNKAAAAAFVAWFSLNPSGGQRIMADALNGAPTIVGLKPNPGPFIDPALQQPSFDAINTAISSATEHRAISYADLVTALGNALQEAAALDGHRQGEIGSERHREHDDVEEARDRVEDDRRKDQEDLGREIRLPC